MSETSLTKKTVDVRDERFEKIAKKFDQMQRRAYEFSQSRSSFQIEKFIGKSEYTPVTQYRHLAHNSYIMLGNVKDMLIEREKILRLIDKCKQKLENHKEDPHYKNLDLKLYSLTCSLDSIEISIKGALAEIEVFERLCDQLERENGGPFTYKQYEEDQPFYWAKRLSNQMHETQVGGKLGIGQGNYASYLEALEEPIIPNGKNKIEAFPLDMNNVATVALTGRKNIEENFLIKKEKIKELENNK